MSCENSSSLFNASPINTNSYQSNGTTAKNYQNASHDMILPSVFVQIPTHHLVPPKTSTVTRHEEIKAEPPIKSENDNANQQQNAVALRSNQKTSSPPTVIPKTTTASIQPNLTANLVTARPKVKCFKCEQCPFMSISQDGYNKHMETVHNDLDSQSTVNRTIRNKILCPGCENVFYSKMSLKIHLVNDHQMDRSDISQLLESLFVKKNGSSQALQKSKESPSTANEKGTVEKQKIYIKNVEVLQNPKFTLRAFEVPEQPPTVLSPVECQSEFSSGLTDDIISMDNNSIASDLSFNRIQAHNNFSQIENNCLYPQISNIEPTFSVVSSPARSNCLSIDSNRDCIPLETVSPATEISVDDSNNRPDSNSSVKFIDSITSWSTIVATTQSSHFQQYQPHVSTNQLPCIKISTNSCQTPTVSPLPSISSCQNERKKIYIKNIDILKEPLIKPTKALTMPDSSCRKNTLHLRTVDEVNLLINKVS